MVTRTNERAGATHDARSFKLFGSTLTLPVTAADTDGAYSLVEYDAPPGQPGSPVHRHEHTAEYIFVLDGSLSIVIDGEETVTGPGGGVLVPPGVEHSFANRGNERARFLTLLRPGGFEALLAEVAARLAEGWEPGPEEFVEVVAPYDIVITDHAH